MFPLPGADFESPHGIPFEDDLEKAADSCGPKLASEPYRLRRIQQQESNSIRRSRLLSRGSCICVQFTCLRVLLFVSPVRLSSHPAVHPSVYPSVRPPLPGRISANNVLSRRLKVTRKVRLSRHRRQSNGNNRRNSSANPNRRTRGPMEQPWSRAGRVDRRTDRQQGG